MSTRVKTIAILKFYNAVILKAQAGGVFPRPQDGFLTNLGFVDNRVL